MIRVRNLGKTSRAVAVLEGVDLNVDRGECLCLLDRERTGSSTLLQVLATLVEPSTGSVEIDGVDVIGRPLEGRRRIGYAGPPEPALDAVTVLEHLRYIAACRGVPPERQPAAVREAMERMRLPADAALDRLDPGSRWRVAVAAALMHAPLVALLDLASPHAGGAALTAALEWIADLRRDGITCVIGLPVANGAASLCDRAATLRGGRIVEISDRRRTTELRDERIPESPESFLRRPQPMPARRQVATLLLRKEARFLAECTSFRVLLWGYVLAVVLAGLAFRDATAHDPLTAQIGFQWVLSMLVVPWQVSRFLTSERDETLVRQSVQTSFPPLAIVSGKLVASGVFLTLLVLTAAPVLVVVGLVGNDTGGIVTMLLELVAFVLLVGVLTFHCSLRSPDRLLSWSAAGLLAITVAAGYHAWAPRLLVGTAALAALTIVAGAALLLRAASLTSLRRGEVP